jgi:succinyl-CoA synthetase beta subunit
VDAKLDFDDNAAFRQARVFSLRDEAAANPRELRAGKAGLSYVQLGGDVGCMVNGAGLGAFDPDP